MGCLPDLSGIRKAHKGALCELCASAGGRPGFTCSLLLKLWDPASEVIVLERNKEGVTHGWGVTMERGFLARLAELDAESAEEIEWRSIRWYDQVVSFGGGREVNPENGEAHAVSRQRCLDILATRARQARGRGSATSTTSATRPDCPRRT